MSRLQDGKTYNNVLLVGLPGCGKSTTGQLLAKKLGFGFLDLDQWIEGKEKKSIGEIFAQYGEKYFRQKEGLALQQVSGICQHVISLGGGIVANSENWEKAKSMGYVVYLDTHIKEAVIRLLLGSSELQNRPLLADVLEENDKTKQISLLSERLESLKEQRHSFYKEAELVCHDAYLTPETLVEALYEQLRKKSGMRVRQRPMVN